MALVVNEDLPFDDKDTEWLESFNEEQLGKVENLVSKIAEKIEASEAKAAPTFEPVTLESIIESAGEFKDTINEALEVLNEKRQAIIEKLISHDGNKFTEEQLAEMETAMLTNMMGYLTEDKKEEKKPTFHGANPNNDPVLGNTKKVEPPEVITLTSHINKKKEEI